MVQGALRNMVVVGGDVLVGRGVMIDFDARGATSPRPVRGQGELRASSIAIYITGLSDRLDSAGWNLKYN